MKRQPKYTLVMVTAPDLRSARKLAGAALRRGLIACANLVPGIESHYRWQGKLEWSPEVLMLLKTTSARLEALEKLIVAEHPYDTPEFIVLPLGGGNARYLAWVSECVKGSFETKKSV